MEAEAVAVKETKRVGKYGEAVEVLFASSHGALRFALNHTQSSLTKSCLAQMLGGGAGEGRGLVGLDGAAQAGMIRAELAQIRQHLQAMIVARLMLPTLPCACRSQCCQGFRAAGEWLAAIDYLTEYALIEGLTGTISHRRLRKTLVMRYFGVAANLVDAAADCGVHRNTISSYNKTLTEHFRDQERAAMFAISNRLCSAGLIDFD